MTSTLAKSTFRDFKPRNDDDGDWRTLLQDAVGRAAVVTATDIIGRTLVVHWSCDTSRVKDVTSLLVTAIGPRAAFHWLETEKFDPENEVF